MSSKEVQKWADPAMFSADPIDAAEGPKVYLLSMTPDPLGSIAATCKMYKGEVVRDLSEVTDAERLEYFEQVQKTKLQAPFEFVQFHFMIEGVTRAFTHQMVRQRTAAYAQESLRFAVKEDMPVGLPPSLAGTTGVWRQHEAAALEFYKTREPGDPEVEGTIAEQMIFESDKERQRWQWDKTVDHIDASYSNLVTAGMPAEDVRGLLPHNVLTRLHYSTNLRNLLDHAGNRLCTQAQFEWRLVFSKIVQAIRQFGENQEARDAESWSFRSDSEGYPRTAWQFEKLADMFRPVCYQTGKCEFKANFDRACKIRDRVDANEKLGRPSSEWHEEKFLGVRSWQQTELLPIPWFRYATDDKPGGDIIPSIQPVEWLADPGAAR